MSNDRALLPAARSMSAHAAFAALRHTTQTTHRSANQPDTRRTEIYLEEPMIHDLYLMSATPWLAAASEHHYQHRTLTFEEMAASGKRRGRNARLATKSAPEHAKGLFLTMLEGVFRT